LARGCPLGLLSDKKNKQGLLVEGLAGGPPLSDT